VRFTEWFRFDPVAAHQKVILAEDFMEFLAPEHWPLQARAGFCWLPADSAQIDCKMKEGMFVEGVNFICSAIRHVDFNSGLY